MDLATLDLAADAERGATITIKNPITGADLVAADGKPVTVSIKGVEGSTYRAVQREIAAAVRAKAAGNEPVTEEDLDEHATKALARVTTGWAGIVVDGEAWAFNPEAAAALYRRFEWLRAQVDQAIHNRALFTSGALS